MKERPILFSAPMVRALLAGTKTQTRRPAKPVKHPDLGNIYTPGALMMEHEPQHVIERACPYGRPGDRLWVRETWMADPPRDGTWPHVAFDGCKPRDMSLIPERYRTTGYCLYRADGHDNDLTGWTPAIHMFRWASRILLEITEVRVERLQDINDRDARAEGAPGYEEGIDPPPPSDEYQWSYRESFRSVWEKINGAESWIANPWVWAVSFKVVKP